MTDETQGIGESVSELRSSLAGDVLVSGDTGYDAARVCFNALVDRRPAVIARCLGAADVASALDFARSHDLEVAVRGGGHNPAGHCVNDGGLVIDLSRLRHVEVDADARIARSGGGATWLDFDTATQRAGLVTPGGVVGSTGVGGLTLGGGIGHLTAQHGLTCDNLIGAEVVTPDGSVVSAGAGGDEALLWGLRGGGGNFGVATRLDFELFPLDNVVGGRLVFQGPDVRDALRVFRDAVASAPRELACQAVLGVDDSGSPTLLVAPCYTGAGEPRELVALRSAPGLVRTACASSRSSTSSCSSTRPTARTGTTGRATSSTSFRTSFSTSFSSVVVSFGRAPSHVLIESLHGAPSDADASQGPIRFRHASFNVSAMAVWREPEQDDLHVEWARSAAAAMEPWSIGGGYANYMQADEPHERVRAAFGDEAFERLQQLKARCDPQNVLHRNQNIPPPGE